MNETNEYVIRVIPSFAEIDRDAWNSLLANTTTANAESLASTQGESNSEEISVNPFMLHEFLASLEESGSANAETGWLGQHLLLETTDGSLLGALPCYLKNHSQGEYVFDHGWADAFERAGGRYYPKLQSSVPFTPATGPRFLIAGNADSQAVRAALAQGLRQLTERHGASSAHITFMPKADWDFTASQDYLLRTDQQFHWQNNGYASFDDFLQSLSSRKRKNIRKERETATTGNGIEIDVLTKDALTEAIWDRFYQFYMDTGARKWGRPYLTREFYSLIGERMADRIVLIMARRDGDYVAGAINFVGDNRLYGRHWGCLEDHPFLHFEVCYYQAIEYAIKNGLTHVEAGAQGAHKLARGYVPVTTHSAHWIAHPGLRNAIEDYLKHERQHVEMENRALARHAPFRKSDT